MNVFDIVLDVEDLLVLGPVSNVEVQSDIGPTGKRGSRFFVGAGDPNNFGVIPQTEEIQIGDYFINSLTNSGRYGWLYVFQAGQNNILSWVESIRLQPSLYSNNFQVDFLNGMSTLAIPIAEITSDASIINTNKYVVQITPLSSEPMIMNVQQKRIVSPTYNTLFLDLRSIRLLLNSWVPYSGQVTVGITVSVL